MSDACVCVCITVWSKDGLVDQIAWAGIHGTGIRQWWMARMGRRCGNGVAGRDRSAAGRRDQEEGNVGVRVGTRSGLVGSTGRTRSPDSHHGIGMGTPDAYRTNVRAGMHRRLGVDLPVETRLAGDSWLRALLD